MRVLRTLVQVLFLGGVVALMFRGMAGATPNTCEAYCPFGGLVALYPLVRYKAYTCALTELNVALLVSTVVLALVAKKSFCGWVCPIGTLQEWLGKLGLKVFRRRFRLPTRTDRVLMNLRYVVLIAVPVLTFTAWQYDLGFRAYDPFYVLFTWGGHGTMAFSVVHRHRRARGRRLRAVALVPLPLPDGSRARPLLTRRCPQAPPQPGHVHGLRRVRQGVSARDTGLAG